MVLRDGGQSWCSGRVRLQRYPWRRIRDVCGKGLACVYVTVKLGLYRREILIGRKQAHKEFEGVERGTPLTKRSNQAKPSHPNKRSNIHHSASPSLTKSLPKICNVLLTVHSPARKIGSPLHSYTPLSTMPVFPITLKLAGFSRLTIALT